MQYRGNAVAKALVADDDARPISSKPQTSGYLRLLLFLVIVFFTPVVVSHLYFDRPTKTPFDTQPLKSLRKLKPRVVLIGNSMLGSRIHPGEIAAVSHKRVALLRADGSASARFYAMMKNYVVASKTHPGWVVVFFRDDELTRPKLRTDGRYRVLLEKAMHESDREIVDILQDRDTPFDFFRIGLESISPAFIGNSNSQLALETKFNSLFFRRSKFRDPRKAFKELGRSHYFRKDIAVPSLDAPDLRRPFSDVVQRSFLPLMLDLAQNNQFRVLFFRVKRRADFKPQRDPRLTTYVQDLRRYVESRNAVLFDESSDPRITEELYGDGDHLSPLAQSFYTKYFWERLGSTLR